ncbi:MAG: hypothetical protein WAL22_04515 [Solirubrobacteraceae bacterium]
MTAYPQMVTRIIVDEFSPLAGRLAASPNSPIRFPATVMRHGHVLEHEDDDLRRRWTIVRKPAV